MKENYHPDVAYRHLEPGSTRDRGAVASFLHDNDISTVEEIIEATGLPKHEVMDHIKFFQDRDAVEILSDGRIEWFGGE